MKAHALRVLLLLAVSAAAGLLANRAGPRRIAWVGDWAGHVETRARAEGLALIERDALLRLLEEGALVVFDARPLRDYQAGHLPGAMPFPLETAEEHLPLYVTLLTPEQPLAAYCGGDGCDEALRLLLWLRRQGATNTALYAGGWDDWRSTKPPPAGGGR